ncbi:MAG TPA: hypothetical protein VL175_17410 [Pirellulales bacterium]|jgi:hypothetical protein|nr:hypothetical protein [Pirellulales bacterium]
MPLRRCVGLAVVLTCVLVAQSKATPPWAKLVVFKHLEADPKQVYSINDQNGPWMIMATTFTGEGAEEQARQLVYELRHDYKLNAYSYQKHFDFSKPVRGKGVDSYGEAPLMRYQQDKDVLEIAVLVGDYPTVDDPEAQKVLKKLKYATPKSLATDDGKASSQSLAGLRAIQKQVKESMLPKDSEELKRGPMANAFVITNPILPSEYFVPKGIDKMVVEMNKGVPHSLLDCPKQYTVKVATFSGHAVILDKKRQEAIDRGELPKSYLEDAAKSAHLLTEALRKKKFEAYEFHDRASSIVTVGSFDSVGTKRADGKIEINPAIHKIMQTFGPETKTEPGKPPQVGQAKKLANIPFDMQPMPVEVPRRMISSDYGRTANLR